MKFTAIEGYAHAAAELIPRFEAISPAELYAPVVHLLPKGPSGIIDLGAGSGRDAAWFAARGQHVLAVEPVAELREAGIAIHQSPKIEWLDDILPALPATLKRGETFDLTLLSAVWQHLDTDQRQLAMPVLRALTRPDGLLVMSLRNGPGSPLRPSFEAPPEEAIDLAIAEGFKLVFTQTADSVQASNRAAKVTWNWLAFTPDSYD